MTSLSQGVETVTNTQSNGKPASSSKTSSNSSKNKNNKTKPATSSTKQTGKKAKLPSWMNLDETPDLSKYNNPSNLSDRLEALIRLDEPILLAGPPGIGKSQRMRQVAKKLGMDFVDVRLSLYDPVDVRGLPYIPSVKEQINDQVTQQVAWAKPDFVAAAHSGRPTLICYEEINCASISTMNTALQFILDKSVGEHHLGENVRQVSCCNRGNEDMAHVQPMSAPLINRFWTFELDPKDQTGGFNLYDEFMAYASYTNMNETVIAFTAFTHGQKLYLPPTKKNRDSDFKNFPTPRAWERVAKLCDAGLTDITYLAGLVGEAEANEFLGFYKLQSKMPNIDNLIEGKEEIKDTSQASVNFQVTVSLARRIINNPDKNVDRAVTIITDNYNVEMGVVFVQMINNSNLEREKLDKILSSKSLMNFITKHYHTFSRVLGEFEE